MSYTLDEIITFIKERESPDTLIDILDIDIEELAEMLADKISEKYSLFNEMYEEDEI